MFYRYCSILYILLSVLTGCSSLPIMYRDVTPPAAAASLAQQQPPQLALVLGGGATRGFAHVGVIRVLEQQGIKPDLVVGTSAGSFVGALYAGGYNAAELQQIAMDLEESALRDVTFPNRGVVKGELLQDYINRGLENRSIESLPIRFAVVATDLNSGEEMVFTQGNTGMAVRASSSIPGLFQPVLINEHEYVDGGLVNPLPVDVAQRMGARIIIAVDVARRPQDTPTLETTVDIMLQTMAIMGNVISRQQAAQADVLIQPRLHIVGRQGFLHKEEAIAAGEASANEVMPRLKNLLQRQKAVSSRH